MGIHGRNWSWRLVIEWHTSRGGCGCCCSGRLSRTKCWALEVRRCRGNRGLLLQDVGVAALLCFVPLVFHPPRVPSIRHWNAYIHKTIATNRRFTYLCLGKRVEFRVWSSGRFAYFAHGENQAKRQTWSLLVKRIRKLDRPNDPELCKLCIFPVAPILRRSGEFAENCLRLFPSVRSERTCT